MIVQVIGSGRVRHNGTLYKNGDIINKITEKEAKRLVNGGDAIFVERFQFEEPVQQPKRLNVNNEIDVTEFEGIELDELKQAAKEAGMSFSPNIGFETLVAKINEEGKAAEILEQFEGEE